MRNIKAVEVEKSDVEKLTEEELKTLVDWSRHEGYGIAIKLAKNSIAKQIEESTLDIDVSEETAKTILSGIAYMRIALNYILGAPKRAGEELKRRGKKK